MARDAYQLFFEQFIGGRKDEFFQFGLAQTIYGDAERSLLGWEDLKHRVLSGGPAYIRRYGTGGRNTQLYKDFYAHLFNNENIEPDPTNNAKPRQLIESLTGYMKKPKAGYEPIQNYQISHVFGRTKNALAFTAPWNIVYLPKLLDPFTGHEAKGEDVAEFTRLFQAQCYERFEDIILDFNEIMENDKLNSRLASGIDHVATENRLTEKKKQQFAKSVYSEFAPIQLEKQ